MARSQQQLGYTVTATDGRAAVDLIAGWNGELALVLLDLAMPVMGGAEALPRIRQHRPELPVAIMTGYGDEATLERITSLGALR